MKAFLKILAASVAAVPLAATAQQAEAPASLVLTNIDYSWDQLNFQETVTGKTGALLKHRADGNLYDDKIYVNGLFKGSVMFEKSNTPGKFPILSRFPNQHGDDTFGVQQVIQAAAIGFTSTFGSWTTMYLQAEYSEVEFAQDQDEFQLRKAYVVLGDLRKFPVYLAFGRKTIDFGNFESYNPFTHSISQHFFWAQSDAPVAELGFDYNGWNATFTAMDGSRHLRVAMSEEGSFNFATKLQKTVGLGGGALTVGASYLHDTIYRNNFTAHTFQAFDRQGPPNAPVFPQVFLEYRNGAADAWLEYNHPRFDLQFEYTQLIKDWPGTILEDENGNPILDGTKLGTFTAQGRYKTELFGFPSRFTALFSQSDLGPSDTEFDFARQHVLSLETELNDYMNVGVEYVFNHGFQPFIGIQDVSEQDVKSHTTILGVRARF